MAAISGNSITTIRCRWAYASVVLQRRGKLDEAEQYIRETLQIATGELGADHPETLNVQAALARVLTAKNDLAQYIGGMFKGALSVFAPPSAEELRELTAKAYRCSPLDASAGVRATCAASCVS